MLIDETIKVIVQGITGRHGTFHTGQMLDYGTRIAAGTSPGKGGRLHLGVPVFDTVREAVETTGASASAIFVPPASAEAAILEAAEAGIRLIVCITEGVPLHDMSRVMEAIRGGPVRLIGPNSPGILIPGKTNIGIIPSRIAASCRAAGRFFTRPSISLRRTAPGSRCASGSAGIRFPARASRAG